MSKKTIAAIAVSIIVIAAAVATKTYRDRSGAAEQGGSHKLSVVASFYPLAYFSERIGGDKADVVNITPASAEPHDYEPTAQDAARIESSDVLVLNGGGLEAWGDSVRANADPSRTAVVVAGEGLATATVEEEGKVMTDPHVWLSPPLAKQMVDRIAAAFSAADGADAAYFRANADALKADLDSVAAAYSLGLAHCAKKDIVTSHAAFGYLAAAYGLHQVPIAGLSPDAEPSPKELADIAAFARKNAVTYIFFESLVSPKLSDTIAAEVGARTSVLDPIEGLTPEDLASGKDYLSEMRQNLVNLRIALECGT